MKKSIDKVLVVTTAVLILICNIVLYSESTPVYAETKTAQELADEAQQHTRGMGEEEKIKFINDYIKKHYKPDEECETTVEPVQCDTTVEPIQNEDVSTNKSTDTKKTEESKTLVASDKNQNIINELKPINLPISSHTIVSGFQSTGFIKEDESLWVSGYEPSFGEEYIVTNYRPIKVLNEVVSVAFGSNSTFAIKKDGSLWGAGDVSEELYDFTKGFIKLLDDVSKVEANNGPIAAIKNDGSLWIIREFYKHDDYYRKTNTPRKLLDNVIDVAFTNSPYGIVAVRSDNSLWTNVSDTPKKLMDNVALVEASTYAKFPVYGVVKTDGTLWLWGSNNQGQLGNGTNIDSDKPKKIMEGVATASIGEGHVVALKMDGSVWTWGDNYKGQLGDGTFKSRNSPVKVIDNVEYAHAKSCSTMVRKKDGTVWVWGHNYYGKLGLGDSKNKTIPTELKIKNIKKPKNIHLVKPLSAIPSY